LICCACTAALLAAIFAGMAWANSNGGGGGGGWFDRDRNEIPGVYLQFSFEGIFATSPVIEDIAPGFEGTFGMSTADITTELNNALSWDNFQFGTDITGAVINPTTFVTSLPNEGAHGATVNPVFLNVTWPLVSSNNDWTDYRAELKVAAFVLTNNAGTTPNYGAATATDSYGQWLVRRSLSTVGLQSDVLSYGRYGVKFNRGCPIKSVPVGCSDLIIYTDKTCMIVFHEKSLFPTTDLFSIFGGAKSVFETCVPIAGQLQGSAFVEINQPTPIGGTVINMDGSASLKMPTAITFTTSD